MRAFYCTNIIIIIGCAFNFFVYICLALLVVHAYYYTIVIYYTYTHLMYE